MKIILISGFLGAGKTTLMQNIISQSPSMGRTAIIVNEFGAVGVDGNILRSKTMDVVEIADGCLCCTLRDSLTSALDELLELRGESLDRIIIEASGVANTPEMIESLRTHASGRDWQAGPFITVVDASKYSELDALLGEFLEHQICSADALILNKTDLSNAQTLAHAKTSIERLNPDAKLWFTERCEVDMAQLLTQVGKHTITASEARHIPTPVNPSAQISTTTLTLSLPQDCSRQAFEQACDALPDSIWRAKGFVMLDGQPYLAQYASGRLELEETDTTVDNKLVFIGMELEKNQILRLFGLTAGDDYSGLRAFDTNRKLLAVNDEA